jgi:Flp pilus assembly protein TadB
VAGRQIGIACSCSRICGRKTESARLLRLHHRQRGHRVFDVFASCRKSSCLKNQKQRRSAMLETIAVVLVLLWLLGLVTSYTMGGLIHILLVIAIVVILIRLIQGRRVV